MEHFEQWPRPGNPGRYRILGPEHPGRWISYEGLVATGQGNFESSLGSGTAAIGVANTGGRGGIQGGAVETSNVDISTEFSDLIVAQRGYEANAKALTTFDQIAMDTLNIIQ
jgi:flagellar hook protein FlgE